MENIIYRIGEAVFTEMEEINKIDYLPEEHEIVLFFKNGKKVSIFVLFD